MFRRPPSGPATEAISEAAYHMKRSRGRATVLEQSPLAALRGGPFPVGAVPGKPSMRMLAMAPMPLGNLEGSAEGGWDRTGRALETVALDREDHSAGAP